MAGFTSKTPGRKQWSLRGDLGRRSLRGLRNQLAEDGDADSQVVLAKQLLEDRSDLDDREKEENCRLAVYWLIKASEQGNEEATHILKQCLEIGRGINELNFLDVKACLRMSQDEKLARRAARKMFARLSSGEDYITSEQLLREMKKVEQAASTSSAPAGHSRWSPLSPAEGSKPVHLHGVGEHSGMNGTAHDQLELLSEDEEHMEQQSENWNTRADPPGEKLSEEHLVSAAVTYAQGELPLVQRVLALQSPDSPPILLFNPLTALVHAYTVVIEVLGRREPPLPLPSISTGVQVLIALVIYSLLGSVEWYAVVPIAVYHGSFMAMIVFTCRMFNNRHEFQHFRSWSGLFLRYSGGSLNPDEAEYQYCRNNLRPYAHFFIALILNIMMYPLLGPHWTPHSELTVLSLSLTFLSLFAFFNSVPHPVGAPPTSTFSFLRKQPDFLVLFSFAVNVLAKYPYDLDSVVTQGWRYLDVRIPTFASYVVGHGIEFCLNFRAVFYLLMPAVFLKMASRDRWRGTYRTLIPHCVTLAWWQIAVITARGSTWYGLIRSALALVGLVLFLPLAGLATVLLPLAAAARYIILGPPREILQTSATTALAATPLLIALWLHGRHGPPGSLKAKLAKTAVRLQIIVAMVAGLLLLAPACKIFTNDNHPVDRHPISSSITDGNVVSEMVSENMSDSLLLSWDQYQSMCHQPAWDHSSVANVQHLCSQLDGVPVKWSGHVTSVKISRVRNPWGDILKRFPESVASLLSCAVASESDEHSLEDHCGPPLYTSPSGQQHCRLVKKLSGHNGLCSLSNWDRYDFEIGIKMGSGLWRTSEAEVTVFAEDYFRNFTLGLRAGDNIWFAGALTNFIPSQHSSVLGGTSPQVYLEKAGCLDCKQGKMTVEKIASHGVTPATIVGYTYVGIKFVLNVLLNPIVIFK